MHLVYHLSYFKDDNIPRFHSLHSTKVIAEAAGEVLLFDEEIKFVWINEMLVRDE